MPERLRVLDERDGIEEVRDGAVRQTRGNEPIPSAVCI